MRIAQSAQELEKCRAELRSSGGKIAFVPTMGALHDGHLSLIDIAKDKADIVIASIYVNPAQFGEGEDFDSYPRHVEDDLKKLRTAGVDLAYTPGYADIYPDGIDRMHDDFSAAQGLESDFRPDFFSGVVTVVRELFDQVQPDIAIFGEKDYQQLCVIRQMVEKLNLPIEIVGGPIARDAHGLALSSRNAYLSDEEMKIARNLPAILKNLVHEIKEYPDQIHDLVPTGIEALYEAGFEKVDYVELCAANTLKFLDKRDEPARLLAAVHIGKTRLIDNWEV